MTVYTTLPTDDLNLAITVVDDPDLVVLNINPATVTGGGGTGTVTNVATGTGLTGGPITTTGTIAIDTTSDISFNTVTSDFFGVQHFTAKARETITAGQPVYISGHSGNTPEVMVADFDDPAKMPAFGIASSDIADNNNGSISTYGDLKDVDTTGTNESETWAVGDELYVNNSKLTNTRPTGSAEEVQKIAKIIRVHANNGQLFLMGAGRSNDTPNLSHYNVFIGNAGGVEKRQLDYTTDILNTPTMYNNADVDAHLNTNLANASEVLTWSGTDWIWTTLSDVATTNDYNDLDNRPTISNTTINNNANNRVITGSDTSNTLEGEADFTWDGNNALIDGSAGGLTSPILLLKTDNSGWNRAQLMCEDSNGKVFSQVGQHNTGADYYQWNITLDPLNVNGRTGVVTSPGEYFVSFEKNYSDPADVAMDMNVYGAHKGFNISVRDDGNSYGGNQYKGRPLNLNALETNINCGLDRNVLALTVKEESIDCQVPIGQVQLASDPSSPANGWTYYNTTTDKLRLYAAGAWVDLN